MGTHGVSRREALGRFAGAAGVSLLGSLTGGQRPLLAKEDRKDERLIDTHFHLAHPRLPGVPDEFAAPDKKTRLAPFDPAKDPDGAKLLAKLIQAEMKTAGVGRVLCMPRAEVSDKDPLGIKEIVAMQGLVEGVKLCPVGFVHPERFDEDHLKLVEAALEKGQVKALKVYLGYLRYGPDHVGYRPYYKLADKYKLPVVFHTGDTYSTKALLKYAEPKLIDEVAVDHPNADFVLAHFGNPSITDAAQVVYKNKNVYADLSGILVGDADAYKKYAEEGILDRAVSRIKQGIEFTESPHKFMFGSDWPLSPVAVYMGFVEKMFPKKHHPAVFRDTAAKLFFKEEPPK
jgi:predicted TIM-barrel fold metal-dependent hydrolase